MLPILGTDTAKKNGVVAVNPNAATNGDGELFWMPAA
jgi:hypothetical protein